MQAHFIEVKAILKNKQKSSPKNLFNDNLEIWHLKNIIVYDMLMFGLKPKIQLNIKLQINDDEKNVVEL